MDKEPLNIDPELPASWYASKVAKLDYIYAKLKIELLNKNRNQDE